MTDILKRELISYRNDLFSQKINRIIPYRKRESSFERNNKKMTARNESSKMGNIKIHIFENDNNNKNNISINDSKKINSNIIKLNNENNCYRDTNSKNEKINEIKNIKDNNITDINMILHNKEKAKTFNRQSNNQKIKVGNNINKNKSNQLSNNSKNKIEKNQADIYIKKLVNENIIFVNDNNNRTENIKNNNNNNIKYNSKYIREDSKFNKNNIKRNTDGIIHIKNQENICFENIKRIKEKTNKVKAKIIKDKDKDNLSNNFNYTINPQNNEFCEQFIGNNFKNKILNSNSLKKINTQKCINNNINNQIESLLKARKNIDINTEYQTNPTTNTFSPEKNNIVNNLNNTTSKVKLKTNNFITNIEMDKDKEFFHLTENSSILKTKSKAKMKLENKKEEPEIEVRIIDTKRKDNVIFNNKRIPTKNNKNKNNEIYNNILTDENFKINNREIKNKNNNNTSKNNCVKVKINNQSQNEQINRNSTYNNNESSFFTININNSNIDEINNEPKHNLGNYNFVSNIHNNNENNNFNINSQINKSNQNNISNNNNNKINNVKVLKSNSNTNKNIIFQNFPIFNENKNYNFNSNNNYSNCNTVNTTNNILNQNYNNNIINNINNKLKKEAEIKDIVNKEFEDKCIKEKDNKDEIVLIEFDGEKEPKNTLDVLTNSIYKKELKKFESLNIKNKEELKEKDISLDKSTSLRVFNVSPEDFIEKDDEVIKLLNSEPSRDNNGKKYDNNNNNINHLQSNEEDESEIIIQNSEFSIMNDYSKYNYPINNKNIYQNSNIYLNNNNTKNNNLNNSNNPNINLDNIIMKDTSIISNFGIKGCKSITQAGKERTGHRKKNQDNYIIEKNLNNILGFNLFAILDGHGENGHIASQLASKYLIKKFTNITNKFNDTESIYSFLKKPDFQKIIDIFLEIDNEIINQKKFDISLSGTTCVLVIQLGEHLICSNIGDSRAILIYEENNKNKIFELSHDSKPDIPEEKKRINLMGGTVDKVEDETGEKSGPYRVYIKNKEQPGLAMSRSFGDKKAKSCGVIPYPDIIEFNLNNNDCKYMVICSDGVWEFLSNEDVMEIGNKYYSQNNMNDFCNELLKKSTEMWENEENYMDDITIVTVFF